MLSHALDTDALLGRRSLPSFSSAARELITGRRVLITGAGGSIGSELVEQILRLRPSAIFLLDHDETHLQEVQLALFGDGQLNHERTMLVDIRDKRSLSRALESALPDIVFHVAALKHVSMLERYPAEAVSTNTLGTQNVIDACVATGVQRLIFVSTDKAADPTSVLGATKNLAELIVRDAASKTLLTASVRFGNVLGSRGSFLPTLIHQLENGLPVTITDSAVERYFMSIPEAAALVVEAAALADRGEVYVLDMGEPIKIVDLVERMAGALGCPKPAVRIIGLGAGEKLTEVLASSREHQLPTGVAKISRIGQWQDELAADM